MFLLNGSISDISGYFNSTLYFNEKKEKEIHGSFEP